MKFESAQNNTITKLPILKLAKYEMWEMRIKQYFQVQDYALWEVIKNGNSWVSIPQTSQENGTFVIKMLIPVTAKEKINKKNDVKARSLLLMALPNEHQLTFSNAATKKTQKALLKKQYENFNASSTKSLDFIFNRLQKLVSRLAILGVVITLEDLNSKFLRSLPPEWNTHVYWCSKLGLYDCSNTSSTKDVNTVNPPYDVSTASSNVNTTNSHVSTANISDNAVYAFIAENLNGSNILQQDLEQIHEDDLEAMDLKWQLSLLSMRENRYYQRTRKNIFINANDTARFDKSKEECFNCHKMGHFARECRAPKNKDGQFRYQDNFRNQENSKRTVNVEDTSSKEMLAIDGVGFDWSDMAEEQVQTNMALMAFSDSEVYTDKTCSKTCLKNYEALKKQCDDLLVKLNETEFKVATYKRGLATVEDQLVTFKKNKVLFSEEIDALKREVGCKDYELGVLKVKYEKVKQEKEGVDFKITKFNNATKDLDDLLASQQTDKNEKGIGYNVVASPHPLIYNRPTKLDLTYSGLDEFKEPEFNGYGLRDNVLKSTIDCDSESDNPKVNTYDSFKKEQVSDNESGSVESPLKVDKETVIDWKETVFHTAKKVELDKPKYNEKPVKRSVSFNHLQINCSNHQKKRIVDRNNNSMVDHDYYVKTSYSTTQRNMTLRAVLLKSGLKPLSTARPGNPQIDDTGFVDSGCLRHMTGNIAYLSDFKEFDGCYVTFGGGADGGRIFGKGTLKTDALDFEDLPDESQILLKIPKKGNMYSFDVKNIVSKESLTCLVAKATLDESILWHKRRGHINFKNMNKLVKENLVRGLPLKRFENDQTCVACLKGTQHRASCKSKVMNPITKPLFMLHMDLFGPTFCTPQQNGVAKRRNRTLIEAARTMLADSKLPTTFWAEAVSTTCYVQNMVLVVKPHNKTPYELFRGKFDGKSDEGFFVVYSLSSKAFRVYNTRTRKVEENLHIGFLKSTQGDLDAGNDDPKSPVDDKRKNEQGPNDNKDDSSTKQDNIVDQSVNTASPGLNTGGIELNTNGFSFNTATPEDMVGPSHSLEATHIESFNDEYEPKVDLGNIPNSYVVPTTPHTRIHKDHPIGNVIGDMQSFVQTRRMTKPNSKHGFLSAIYEGKNHKDLYTCLFACFLSQEKPKRISKALSHRAIGTKWVFQNKKDERGIVIRNKARLVAQGHTQEECMDYDEVFAPVARIEAIRLFLAYVSFMGFMVYQMDVKSAFLYGQIEEEVYVCQPLGFEDPDYPDKVYKVEKALYGLNQAPRAWYETLANYLLSNGFHRGKIDPTLFIKKQKGDILLVQIYVDDIIFGFTKEELCTEFEKLVKDKFQMSSMGELTFFLGLQVKQKKDRIFISQDKYVDKILRKFNYSDVKSASTPVDLEKPLVIDGDGTDLDEHLYRSMIGSLMYITASRPDIMFAISERQNNIRPLDSDYAGATQDRKSTTGAEYVAAASCCGQVLWIQNQLLDYGYNFMNTMIHIDNNNLLTKGFDAGRFQYLVLNVLLEGRKILLKSSKVKNGRKCYIIQKGVKQIGMSKEVGTLRYLSLVVPLIKVGDEAVHKELGDRMEKAATTASSLEAEQDSGSGPRHVLLLLGEVNTVRLEFRHKHNMVAYLIKSKGSEDFYEIIDFLSGSHISYALTESPILYMSLIEQFWQTAALSTTAEGVQAIAATIDGKGQIITEASLRRHLKLEDSEGLPSLPNEEIFEQLTNIGYAITSDSLTFFKGHFSPQWKFFIHIILHCMSSKKTAWDQFSSNIANAIICLATNRTFNFSKFIFEVMVKNLNSPHKFLMYPRFIQIVLNKHQRLLLPYTRTYPTPTLTNKLFSNIRRPTQGYSGVITPLFDTMLIQPQGEAPSTSPSRVTSSPSHHTPSSSPTTSPSIQTHHETEEHVPTPHDSPLHCVHSHGSDEGRLQQSDLTDLVTKLSDRVEVLEKDLQETKKTYNDEDVVEDSSKQGRKIAQIDSYPNISLVQDEGMTWFHEDEHVQEKHSDDTEVSIEEEEPTEIVEDKVSIASATADVSTASQVGSTAGIKAKYKGKGIMQEYEPSKKIKKRVQIQMTVDQELAKKRFEEEQARFNAKQEARAKKEEEQEKSDFKVAQELQKQLDERRKDDSIDWNIVVEQLQERQSDTIKRYQTLKRKPISLAQARKNMMVYLKNMAGYKMNYFKEMSYDDIRPLFEMEYNKVQTLFKNRDVEEEKGQKVLDESAKKTDTEQVEIESSKKARGSRKKLLARKKERESHSEESSKKQKLEDDAEKEELQGYLTIVSEDEGLDVASLVTNAMMYDFNRQDVLELYRLVKERFRSESPEGYDLLLWGDMKTMMESNAEDEIWGNQQDWNLISWKLHNFCGVHVILMQDGLVIHMLVERKYPLSQDILSKMLSRRLEVDYQSEIGYELIRFIKSQLQQ
ncbi:putative ribonuclease H-like domain-containing protein [Tanacetum coccineum]